MSDWHELSFTLTGLDHDRVEDALLASGAVAVTLVDAADTPVLEPAPGETPLWDHIRITGLFAEEMNIEQISEALRATLGLQQLPELRIARLADRDWSREWLQYFKPLKFGRQLWIVPTAYQPPEPDALNIILDPGLAFGTGTHPTTALCLEWLDSIDVEGKSVVDYGCGSGILAIAAGLLGASDILATDIDPQALLASRENAERNHVADRLTLCLPDAVPEQAFDIVVANILAAPLMQLADTIQSLVKPGGQLALAGLLREQAAEVIAAYTRIPLAITAERDGWVRLSGRRPA